MSGDAAPFSRNIFARDGLLYWAVDCAWFRAMLQIASVQTLLLVTNNHLNFRFL